MLVDLANTFKVDIPKEPGAWLELRMLSGSEMEECRDKAQEKSMETMQSMGDLAAIVMGGGPERDEQGRMIKHPETMDSFDGKLLLSKALMGWSYDIACNESTQGMMDLTTRSFAIREIWDRNRDRSEDERGND